MPVFLPVRSAGAAGGLESPPLAVVTPADVLRSPRARFESQLRLFDAGPLVRLRTPGFCFWFTHDAAMAHHVLVENAASYDKPASYDVLKIITGEGLLTVKEARWRQQRRLVQHAFRPRAMASYAAVMEEEAQAAAELWEQEAEAGTAVDIAAEMTRLTLAIVSRALLGVDFSREAAAVGSALTLAMQHANNLLFSPFAVPSRWPTPGNRRAARAIAELHGTVDALIQARRRAPKASDLLGELIGSRDEATGATLSDEELRDQTLTLFLAGYETTANSLSWAFWLLAQHEAVAAAVAEEAQTVLAGRPPRVEDLPRLPLLGRVFSEALRLYPPAWSVGREALADDRLGPYHVPKGSIVGVHILGLHRNPAYYRRPDAFDPEHFSPEAVLARPRHAYMPFGAGPRVCIGQHFALQEGLLILATLAARFRLRLTGRRVAPELTLVLKPDGPVWAHLERRVSSRRSGSVRRIAARAAGDEP